MPRAHARVICNSLRCGMDACCHTLNLSRSSAEPTVFAQAVRFRLRDNCADESPAVQPQGGGNFRFGGFFTPCYLVVHSCGTLMWDVGQIPDANFPAGGGPATQGSFTSTKPLLPQLAASGYKPSDITYFTLSRYHSDHTANANEFAYTTNSE